MKIYPAGVNGGDFPKPRKFPRRLISYKDIRQDLMGIGSSIRELALVGPGGEVGSENLPSSPR